MRHLTISGFGTHVGISGNLLVVREKELSFETPLSRLRSVRIEKEGISISSAAIMACAARGIRFYFTDWRNISVAAVQGCNQHATVAIRQAQFESIRSEACREIALELVRSKIRNQRAVLLYFGKYLRRTLESGQQVLASTVEAIDKISDSLTTNFLLTGDWRGKLLGIEGKCAALYWDTLSRCALLPETFKQREGRGSLEITNAALNYGYSILSSYCWSALDNTGLELYSGILHSNHPGRASLVTDFIEEYRAWVVDRNIIKLRQTLSSASSLTPKIKKTIVNAIDDTMSKKIGWQHKQIKLESLMQRQAYRLAGSLAGRQKYKGVRFKW